jgi:hypothetical protein
VKIWVSGWQPERGPWCGLTKCMYNRGDYGTQAWECGPYEILAAIGACGMGEVYRATDTRLGRGVAKRGRCSSQRI